MTALDNVEFMKKYAKCPKCGSVDVGSDKGSLLCDTEKGHFKRTCNCGWFIEIKEDREFMKLAGIKGF